MKPEHIKSATEIQGIRKYGNTFSNTYLVLIAQKNESCNIRFAVLASRSVGGAVQRNRCKRLIRARFQKYLESLEPGYDLVFIARKNLLVAQSEQIDDAFQQLLEKAGLNRND